MSHNHKYRLLQPVAKNSEEPWQYVPQKPPRPSDRLGYGGRAYRQFKWLLKTPYTSKPVGLRMAKLLVLVLLVCFLVYHYSSLSSEGRHDIGTRHRDRYVPYDVTTEDGSADLIESADMSKVKRRRHPPSPLKSAWDEVADNFNLRFHARNTWIEQPLNRRLFRRGGGFLRGHSGRPQQSKVFVYSAYGDVLALLTDGNAGIFTGIKIVALTETSFSNKFRESPDNPVHFRLFVSFFVRLWENLMGWCVYIASRLTNRANFQHPWCHVVIYDNYVPSKDLKPDQGTSFKPGITHYYTRAYLQELPENHGYDWTASVYYCPLNERVFRIEAYNATDSPTNYDRDVIITRFPVGVRLTSEKLDDLTNRFGPHPSELSIANPQNPANDTVPVHRSYVKELLLPRFHHVRYPNANLKRFRVVAKTTSTNVLHPVSEKLDKGHSPPSPLSESQNIDLPRLSQVTKYQIALRASVSGSYYAPKHARKSVKVNVCIPSLFGALDDAFFLTNFVQAMEWFNLNGISNVQLYRVPYGTPNRSTTKHVGHEGRPSSVSSYHGETFKIGNGDVDSVISYYLNGSRRSKHYRTKVNLKVWSLPEELVTNQGALTAKVHYYGQVANIQDCLFQNGNGAADLVFFQDFDEIIFATPNGAADYLGLFENISNSLDSAPMRGRRRIKDVNVCGHVFRSTYMDIFDYSRMQQLPRDKKFSLKSVKYHSTFSSNLTVPIRDFDKSISDYFPHGIRSKYAVYPDRLLTIGIHEPHLDIGFFTKWLFGPRGLFSGGWFRHRNKRKHLMHNLCTDGLDLVPTPTAYIRHFSSSVDPDTANRYLRNRETLSHETTDLRELPKLVFEKSHKLAHGMLKTLRGDD